MEAAHRAMKSVMEAEDVTLHVRITNRAAVGLYKGKLNYEQLEIDKGYYADGEDAIFMRKVLKDLYNLGIDEEPAGETAPA